MKYSLIIKVSSPVPCLHIVNRNGVLRKIVESIPGPPFSVVDRALPGYSQLSKIKKRCVCT